MIKSYKSQTTSGNHASIQEYNNSNFHEDLQNKILGIHYYPLIIMFKLLNHIFPLHIKFGSNHIKKKF